MCRNYEALHLQARLETGADDVVALSRGQIKVLGFAHPFRGEARGGGGGLALSTGHLKGIGGQANAPSCLKSTVHCCAI